MDIKIASINLNGMINFSCDAGKSIGTLKTTKTIFVNDTYSVEFDVDTHLQPNINSKVSELKKYKIASDNSTVILNVLFDGYDDGGMGYFRLDSSCLIMIETEDNQFKEGQWVLINLDVSEFVVNILP
jgi:hypothetical protein